MLDRMVLAHIQLIIGQWRKLEKILIEWNEKYATGYYRDPQHRADEYLMDIREIVDFWKNFYDEKQDEKRENEPSPTSIQEQKLRQIIRKVIKR